MDIVVLNNDSDPEGDPLAVDSATDPANGTATVNPDGTITYTPDPGFAGVDTFEYTISDGNGGTDTATVSVTVRPPAPNQAPDAANDPVDTNENQPVDVVMLANDTDLEGDPLTVDSITQPGNGTAVLNPDGTATYTPTAGFIGTDTFTYTISDGNGNTSTAIVTVTVNGIPTAVDDDATTPEDTPVDIVVLDDDTDPETDPLSVTSLTKPANGTAVINPDGTITYTPDPDFNGVDSFVYAITDPSGNTDTATVTLIVDPVDDLPVANDDAISVSEDGSTIGAVLTNDDGLGDGGLMVAVTAGPESGSLILNPDGTFEYVPDGEFNGTDTFVYEVCDVDGDCDTATVTVSVESVNDVPVANDDEAASPEAEPVSGNVLDNDTGLGDGGVEVALTQAPTNGTVELNADGTYAYMPAAGFVGTDTFVYEVCDADGDCDTATVTIAVNANATLGDRVWNDLDADGVQDPDEEGIAGAVVTLVDADGTVVATATTGTDGSYLFEELAAGVYTVELTELPDGFVATTDPALDSDIAAGDVVTDADFGATLGGAIAGRVFVDANRDGAKQSSEPVRAGVTVTLYDASGEEVAITTTDSDGNYEFSDLVPGDYELLFVAPDGTVIGPQGVDSDADPSTGRVRVQVFAGAVTADVNSGLAQQNPAEGSLAQTGLDSDDLATLAIAMLLVGMTLVILPGRRRWSIRER